MTSVSKRYRALVDEVQIKSDPAQAALVEKLDALCGRLRGYKTEARPSAFSRLFGAKPAEAPRGLYLYGSVGRGKTMLMDLFFAAVEAPDEEVEATLPVVAKVMIDAPEPALKLSVPLMVDARAARNWEEAH